MSAPQLTLIAGPNGSGKSTLAQQIAPDWINPDTCPGGTLRARGRWAILETRRRVSARRSFALESTLSGQWTTDLVNRALQADYLIALHFIAVSSSDLAAERIAVRVALGGHDVPRDDQERRFPRTFANASALSVRCHALTLYDNSGAAADQAEHRIVGRRGIGKRLWLAKDAPPWTRLFLRRPR